MTLGNSEVVSHSLFSDTDIYLFKSGKHFRLFERFGSHEIEVDGVRGTYFAVFAPAARRIEVIGNFNYWSGNNHSLYVRWDSSGIWEGFIPGVLKGELYKYRIYSEHDSQIRDKADPYSLFYEVAPKSSSINWSTDYAWGDSSWMTRRNERNLYAEPMSIYEVHLGSWMKSDNDTRSLHYTEMADKLVNYVKDMGYTHVELLPITEHPYYPSWGYLSVGFFAPTSRYGTPQDFMYLIDQFHQADIGVILDWVPAHFPSDTAFLADFDGSSVYEHPNPQKGYHPDWNSLIFNFERPEIRSFLISSACFWLEKYHMDGLRVDAVASMLYLDYSRKEGEWTPNEYGDNHNLSAISFLKDLNQAVYAAFTGITMMAEESTAYAKVTKPVYEGGLGFGFKWMMGWMNDTLRYISRDTLYRPFHHNEISFSMAYAYSESYILPLSHDEIVHGKGSLINKMPGDEWQQFANLRMLYGYMYSHPGHKLLFMGNDIGQRSEWNVNAALEWHLLKYPFHQGINLLVKELNHLLKIEPALYSQNFDHEGFQWIDFSDHKNCIISYLRKTAQELILCVCNFTPSAHYNYELGVPHAGEWRVIFDSDDRKYSGSGFNADTKIKTIEKLNHGHTYSLNLTIPPLSTTMWKYSMPVKKIKKKQAATTLVSKNIKEQ